MGFKDRTYLFLSLLIVFSLIAISAGQNFWKIQPNVDERPEDRRIKLIWCTISYEEQRKCYNFAMANERDRIRVGYDYFKIECYQATSKDECMKLLDEEKATLTTLDAAEVFVGGRYHSLVPISQEVLDGGFRHYYAVAVLKRGTVPEVQSLHDLRNKRACFAGVESFAGWVLPIQTLMKEGGMDIVDCNNHVKTATKFFGPSCVVNCLTDKYNPIGDNSDQLCQLCIGKIPGGRCTDADPYAGYTGAFRCLLEAGDVAFLRHTTIPELVAGDEFIGITKDSFELLCKDGTRRSVDDFLSCNWGKVPSNTIVTTSASSFELRRKYQLFMEKAAKLYPITNRNTTTADTRPNLYGDNNQPQYDTFGNRLERQKRQDFGSQNRNNEYNPYGGPTTDQDGRNNPSSTDQYGRNPYSNNNNNRENPYGSSNDNQYGRNNPYGTGNSGDSNNPYGTGSSSDSNNPIGSNNNPYGSGNNPYGSNNQYGRNNPYGSNNDDNPYRSGNSEQDDTRYGNRNEYGSNPYDPNNRNRSFTNPFARDPFFINPNQFGQNIDPYVDDPHNRNRGPFQYNNTLGQDDFWFNRTNVTFYEVFSLFESSPRYGIHSNLLFQDATRTFAALSESEQTYNNFLGQALDIILGLRDCQVNRMTLCVTSDAEKDKCIKMRTALKAQLLKPEMDCYKGHSQIHCMQAIRSGTADVAVLDASDVYTAGWNYDLIPFISEVYNLDDPEYYVVAVAKVSDPSTELTYLRAKNTCHGGINTAAGWVYPLAFLISNGWIRPYGCNSIRAAAEYFSKSCVPGALSTEYNSGVPYDNMCHLCHGASYRYCRRDASEDYYGHTGAFRCLVEGGGHVAFVKHTTVNENIGGKREEWWARDNLNEDFELLCPDGTRAGINQYRRCNLGKVRANAIVTRGGYEYNHTHINAFINLFLYAQTFYGRKTTDEFSFSMFSSPPPYTDLIFQDATTQLKVIEPDKRYYSTYLGSDFMRARRIVDCHAGSASIASSILILSLSLLIFRL